MIRTVRRSIAALAVVCATRIAAAPLALTLAPQRSSRQPLRGICTLQPERGDALTIEVTSAAETEVAAPPDAHFAMTCRIDGWWTEARDVAARDGAIAVKFSERGIAAEGYRSRYRRYWLSPLLISP